MTIQAGLSCFVPKISQWQLQSQKDIYDTIDDWDFHQYVCIMKDGKRVFAFGIADEAESGMCGTYINFEEGKYDADDILYWIEIPKNPDVDLVQFYGEDKIKEAVLSYRDDFLKEIKNGI